MRTKIVALSLLVVGVSVLAAQAPRQEPALLTPERFAQIHRMIAPQSGELRFQEIPWLLSVWEARRQAAREGKPILIWSGSGGAPLGVC